MEKHKKYNQEVWLAILLTMSVHPQLQFETAERHFMATKSNVAKQRGSYDFRNTHVIVANPVVL